MFSLFVETIMIVAWSVLFVTGIAFQMYRDRNQPHFPPPPRRSGQGILSRQVSVRRLSAEQLAPPPYSEQDDFDERRPLLSASPQQVQVDHWPRQQPEAEVRYSNTF